MKKIALMVLMLFAFMQIAAALSIRSISTDQLYPGSEGNIRVEVKNVFDEEVSDVSMQLNFANSKFIPVTSSEDNVEEILVDKKEEFSFRIKASNDIKPGDYEIPYSIKYTIDSIQKEKTGTIGVKVFGNPDLSYSLSVDKPVLNSQAKLTIKIVNKGFYDARFASVKIIPNGFDLISEPEVYIGNIDSDDFETINFDIVLKAQNAELVAIVQYKDFDSKLITQQIQLPIKVYSVSEAKALGIITQSYALYYVGIAIVVLVLWFVWRSIRKRQRLKRSLQGR